MPHRTPVLTVEGARDLIRERSFASGTGHRFGVELEWFTISQTRSFDVEALSRLLTAVEPLPNGSAITFEPGGQIELSSLPATSVQTACDAIASDAQAVRSLLAQHGIDLLAAGFDPQRRLDLRTSAPRYVAMRTYFDAFGPAGGRMMCGSAAIHVNVDAGLDDEGRARFEMAHLAGPTLLAAFANSPRVGTTPSGWKSSRFAAWRELDPSRTRALDHGRNADDAWPDYALDARVMFVRDGDVYRPMLEALSCRDWIEHGCAFGYPDGDDVAYHLTTLFPPVRPHGHLELRMIDMLPDPWWRVAVAVAASVVCDPTARGKARPACKRSRGLWEVAARCGLEDPFLHASALACFDGAIDCCRDGTKDLIAEYADRFVNRGRCPADDELDRLLVQEAM